MVYCWWGQPKKAVRTSFAANSSFLCRFIDIIFIYDKFVIWLPLNTPFIWHPLIKSGSTLLIKALLTKSDIKLFGAFNYLILNQISVSQISKNEPLWIKSLGNQQKQIFVLNIKTFLIRLKIYVWLILILKDSSPHMISISMSLFLFFMRKHYRPWISCLTCVCTTIRIYRAS